LAEQIIPIRIRLEKRKNKNATRFFATAKKGQPFLLKQKSAKGVICSAAAANDGVWAVPD